MSCAANVYSIPVPGPQGPAGADGAAGANGQPAFTLTTTSFTMPNYNGVDTAVVEVEDTSWIALNQAIYFRGGSALGYLFVISIPDSTHVEVSNPASGPLITDYYTDNSVPGTIFPAGSKVTSGGIQGPPGITPGDALLAANNLSDVNNPATSRTNLGLGTSAVLDAGVTNGDLPPIDTTFTSGDALFATATGLQTKTAANARTALGVTIGTNVQAYNAFLASIATLGTAADKMIYTTGVNTAAEAALTAYGRSLVAAADYGAAQTLLALYATNNGRLALHQNVDLNTVGDNVFPVLCGDAGPGCFFIVDSIILYNASGAITTAEVALYTAAGGGGTNLAAPFALTGLSGTNKFVSVTMATAATTDFFIVGTVPNLYLRVTTPEGSAATCAAIIFGRVFDN